MSTPTNIPETPIGGPENDSYPKSKEKFQQQLQDIFQTALKLTGPGPFDQLSQWMEYNQYLTIDDFYHSSKMTQENLRLKAQLLNTNGKGR